jgi:hypothetical protein
MKNNTLILLELHKIYNLSCDENEKMIIKQLIDKRQNPYLINFKNDFSNHEIGQARKYINKKANFFIDKHTLNIKDFHERISHNINWYDKSHWLYSDNTYNNLAMLRVQLFRQKGTPLYKNSLELLNIYTDEQLEILINKHFKL